MCSPFCENHFRCFLTVKLKNCKNVIDLNFFLAIKYFLRKMKFNLINHPNWINLDELGSSYRKIWSLIDIPFLNQQMVKIQQNQDYINVGGGSWVKIPVVYENNFRIHYSKSWWNERCIGLPVLKDRPAEKWWGRGGVSELFFFWGGHGKLKWIFLDFAESYFAEKLLRQMEIIYFCYFPSLFKWFILVHIFSNFNKFILPQL